MWPQLETLAPSYPGPGQNKLKHETELRTRHRCTCTVELAAFNFQWKKCLPSTAPPIHPTPSKFVPTHGTKTFHTHGKPISDTGKRKKNTNKLPSCRWSRRSGPSPAKACRTPLLSWTTWIGSTPPPYPPTHPMN